MASDSDFPFRSSKTQAPFSSEGALAPLYRLFWAGNAEKGPRNVVNACLSASRPVQVIAHHAMKYFASRGGVSYHRHSTNKISPVGFAAMAKTAAGQTSGPYYQ